MTKPLRTTTTVYVRIPNEIEQKLTDEAARLSITKKELICRALNDSVAGKNLLLDEMLAMEQRLKKFMLRSVQATVEDAPEEIPQIESEFDKVTRRA